MDLVFEAKKEKFKEGVKETLKDNLDWGVLYKEIKNLVRKQQSRSWKEIVKLFAMTLALTLLPTLFDIGTDSLTLNGFINGAYYTKYVPSINHPSVNCTNDPDCISCRHVARRLKIAPNSSEEVEYEEFECLEKDPIWGYLSLTLIFLPGFLGAAVLGDGAGIGIWLGLGCGSVCFLGLLCWPFFPLFAVIVKILELFKPGPNWTLLTKRFTVAEANIESKYQFLLQLFIVFTRADRQPSTTQIFAMFTSLAMLTKINVEDLHAKMTVHGLEFGMKEKILTFARTSTGNFGLAVGFAANLALLRYWFPFLLLVFVLGSLPLGCCCACLLGCCCCCWLGCKGKEEEDVIVGTQSGENKENKTQDKRPPSNILNILKNHGDIEETDTANTEEGKKSLQHQAFLKKFNVAAAYALALGASAQTVILTALTITANVAPDLELPGLFWEGHKLSDLTIVEKIYLLNFAFLLVLLATVASIFLSVIEKRMLDEVIQSGKDFLNVFDSRKHKQSDPSKNLKLNKRIKAYIYFRDH